MSHSGGMPGSLPFPLGGALIATTTSGAAGSVGRAWKLDPITGDRVREGGRFVRVGGIDSVAQDIRCALATFQEFDTDGVTPIGEWAFDFTVGVPYRRDVLIKNPDLVRVREIFRRVVAARKGVTEVTQMDLELDAATRNLSITLAARVDLGLLAGIVSGTVSGVL